MSSYLSQLKKVKGTKGTKVSGRVVAAAMKNAER